MSRIPRRKLASALLALSLLPGLVLGHSGFLPCPHMAAMGGEMEHGASPTGPTGMSMDMAPGGPMHASGDASPHGMHGVPANAPGERGSEHPTAPMPCTCAGGCPGAAATESLPVAAADFQLGAGRTFFLPLAEAVEHLPQPVAHLLPFPLGPPLSA